MTLLSAGKRRAWSGLSSEKDLLHRAWLGALRQEDTTCAGGGGKPSPKFSKHV